jgi:ABC-type transport system substrate-binding protein
LSLVEFRRDKCRAWLQPVIAVVSAFWFCIPMPMDAKAATEGILRVGLESDLTSFDVLKANSFGSSGIHIANSIMEPLLDHNRDGTFSPRLAKSWKQSRDKLVWTFKLRQGVVFHNGNGFSAQDVAHHFRRILKPKNRSALRGTLARIKEVKVVDRWTVSFVLRESWPELLNILSSPSSMSLIPSIGATKSGGQQRRPVGTGPFRLVSWKPGHKLIVESNSKYWKKNRPYLKKIEFRMISDTNERFALFQKGGLDVVRSELAEHIEAVRQNPRLKDLVHDGPGASIIVLNTRRKPLDDWRVRQAIAYAWDQKSIIRDVYQNEIGFVPHPFGGLFKCKDVAYRGHDLQKARKLVKQYGKKIRFEYIFINTPGGRILADAFSAQMKKAGISVRKTEMKTRKLLKSVFSRNFMTSSWRFAGEHDLGNQIVSLTESGSAYNLSGIKDKKLDQLALKIKSAGSQRGKRAAMCNAIRELNNKSLVLWHGSERVHTFVRRGVKGFPADKHRFMEFTNVSLSRR